MEKKIQDLFEIIKNKHKYAPGETIRRIQMEQNSKGHVFAGGTAKLIAYTYVESIEVIIFEFLDQVLRNSEKLNLFSTEKIRTVVLEALQTLTVEIPGMIFKYLAGPDQFKKSAFSLCEEGTIKILEDVNRKINLRDLNLSQPPASLQINSDQIGNLIIGSQNQSYLNASVQKIINQGGEESKAGEILNDFIQLVGKLNEQHSEEKALLLDLTKGLIQMIQQPKEERSKSSMVMILGKIKIVAEVSHELNQFIQEYWPLITAGLGLLTG